MASRVVPKRGAGFFAEGIIATQAAVLRPMGGTGCWCGSRDGSNQSLARINRDPVLLEPVG